MTFVLVDKPAHWWPVTWNSPADGGTVTSNTIELKFIRVGAEEFVKISTAISDGMSAEEVKAYNVDLFRRLVVDWRKIVLPNGEPVPFKDEFIAQMSDVGGFGEAWATAYGRFWKAIPETVLGNSEPSPAGGPASGDAAAAEQTTETSSSSSPPPSADGAEPAAA